jgi:hypothetical protein
VVFVVDKAHLDNAQVIQLFLKIQKAVMHLFYKIEIKRFSLQLRGSDCCYAAHEHKETNF